MSNEGTPAVLSEFANSIVAVVSSIESGVVMTYGEVAAEAGHPGAARAVGGVLRASEDLPWWRVVASNGRLVPGLVDEHRQLLESEGWTIRSGRVVASENADR